MADDLLVLMKREISSLWISGYQDTLCLVQLIGKCTAMQYCKQTGMQCS